VLRALRVPATVYVATGYTGTRRRMLHDRIFAALTALARRGEPPHRVSLDGPAHALYGACARSGPASTLDRLIARVPHDGLVLVTEALEARAGIREEDLPAGTRLLDWEELRALDAGGVEVGGHSVRHAVLANLTLAEARKEIEGCRDQIAERLGKRPRHFAYPNGYHTPAVRRAVAEAGFETGVTTEDRENLRGADLLALRRKVLWENSTLGPIGYSPALAACAFDGVFHALGLARAVDGERADAPEGSAGDEGEPERAAS
jgi:peptidoglycan/xylan/chitin deacetylase (PgdA/CDA1 family)